MARAYFNTKLGRLEMQFRDDHLVFWNGYRWLNETIQNEIIKSKNGKKIVLERETVKKVLKLVK